MHFPCQVSSYEISHVSGDDCFAAMQIELLRPGVERDHRLTQSSLTLPISSTNYVSSSGFPPKDRQIIPKRRARFQARAYWNIPTFEKCCRTLGGPCVIFAKSVAHKLRKKSTLGSDHRCFTSEPRAGQAFDLK